MNAGGLTAVLFDVGNVLIEWDPRHLYRKIFFRPDGTPDRARIEWFLNRGLQPGLERGTGPRPHPGGGDRVTDRAVARLRG